MSNKWLKFKWFQFVIAGVAVLAVVFFGASDIKIPGSGMVAAVIDAIIDTTPIESAPVESAAVLIEPAAAEPTSTSTEPAPTEPAPAEPTSASSFQDLLQIFLPPLSIENPVPAPLETGSLTGSAAPKGASRLNLKVFILTQDALESTVNEWFAVQEGIVVDQLTVQDYGGGGYLAVVSYHTGGVGNSSTRLKLIAGENSETDAQVFLSSLGASQKVHSIAATTGSYFGSETTITVPIIFIIYE